MAMHEFADMSARRGMHTAFAFNRFAAESYYRLVELVREDTSATDHHFAPVNAVTNLVDRADMVRVNHHVQAFEDACTLRWFPGELRPAKYSSSLSSSNDVNPEFPKLTTTYDQSITGFSIPEARPSSVG
jgi:hypothetical protein